MTRSAEITRREAVRRLTVLTGAALSSSTVTALLSGCRAEPPPPDWSPETLTASQLDLLSTVVDRILPRTDTPGAVDVGVPRFIDLLLSEWAEPDEVALVLAGLDEIDLQAQQARETDFVTMDVAAQDGGLAELDRASVQAAEADEGAHFFGILKQWTLSGYYTSEAGATEELRYEPAPGRYEDVPLDEVGRTWA